MHPSADVGSVRRVYSLSDTAINKATGARIRAYHQVDALYHGTPLQPSPGNHRSAEDECPFFGKGRAHADRQVCSRIAHQSPAGDQAGIVEDAQPSRRSQGLVGEFSEAQPPRVDHRRTVTWPKIKSPARKSGAFLFLASDGC